MASGIVQAGLSRASVLNLQDFSDERLSKASALIHQTFGEGGDEFRMKSGEEQDVCLWAIAGLIDEAIAAQKELGARHWKLTVQQRLEFFAALDAEVSA